MLLLQLLPLQLKLGLALGSLLLAGLFFLLLLLRFLLVLPLEFFQFAPGPHLLGLQRQFFQPLPPVLQNGRSIAHRPNPLRSPLPHGSDALR